MKDWTALVLATVTLASCVDSGGRDAQMTSSATSTCMTCHNGSQSNDYAGPGIENPHPFGAAANLSCTTCHGGNGQGETAALAHVPPPPQIGDDQHQINNREAYFNRLTLTGIDKYPDYQANGRTYTALQYLQFVNPGDLRVVESGLSCGQCHAGHVEEVSASLLATSAGVFSGAMYAAGVENAVPANVGLYEDTAADLGFRAEVDSGFAFDAGEVGPVSELVEFPVYSRRNVPGSIHNNPAYDVAELSDDRNPDNSLVTGSALADLYHEQVAFTCGDCHLGSAGANNRAGDFRSSGCTSCHMPYSLGGRSGSSDPNVNKVEPLDPDDIDPPERSHVASHRIQSIAKTLPGGQQVQGISDYACAGCHQGSNRTVMQFWGIRLDQNQDVRRGRQYPANPDSHVRSFGDTRLFDPAVGNHTFNGRNGNQYLVREDYDGDGRDDTPPDVHYEAGMGCIDCHGSFDLHGGDVNTPGADIHSRMGQAVAIACEDCHGGVDAYATTVSGLDYDGVTRDLAVDSEGNVLRHVWKDSNDHYFMRSRLTGTVHYVKQTLDTIVDNGRTNPIEPGNPAIYTAAASYAMGRNDGDPGTGLGPQQTGSTPNGFSHADNMSCESCHASWTNNCIGCHLIGEYNTGNNFSNITGERIVFREDEADFVYQSPVPFQLGIGPDNKIAPIAPNTEMFFRYEDRNNDLSEVFAFSDRNGGGNNPTTSAFPALSHNVMMPHSIRGKVNSENEGPRYCVACHLTDDSIANFGTQYDSFRTAMATNDFASLDYNLLAEHIGENPGNQLDSPMWVHMVAGLGSGLFLFDENGCPVNPLDNDDQRKGCEGVAPASSFDPNRVYFNLDRLVEPNGVSNSSSNHPMLPGSGTGQRDGSLDANLAGPLGSSLIFRLTDPTSGIVLDSWLDANGAPQGDAASILSPPP